MATDSVVPSSRTSGRGRVTGSASQSTEIVFASPSSSAKPITISSGDTFSVAPSDGDELTTVFSAAAPPGASPMTAASARRSASVYRCSVERRPTASGAA